MSRDIHLKREIAEYLGTDEAHVEILARAAPKTYRRYTVPKRSGHGLRTIYHPARKTKALQYALIEVLLDLLPVHAAAYAYRGGLKAPLLKHASIHSQFPYSVRTDFRDFFPSLVPDDLIPVIESSGILASPLTADDRQFLSQALFVNHHGRMCLGIGAPSSPVVSNAVMYALDVTFMAFASERDCCYTRYADDLVFSSGQKGMCSDFVEYVTATLAATKSPTLTLNVPKTLFMSRGTRRCITGLFVTPEKTVSMGRKRKRRIRSLLHKHERYKRGEIEMPKAELDWLKGNLAFALDVEPDYYNRLVHKYSARVVSDALLPRGLRAPWLLTEFLLPVCENNSN